MAKVECVCAWCGVAFTKPSWEVHERNFCCIEHFRHFASKRMTAMNEDLNPTRMTSETRAKLRKARLDSGDGATYTKVYGRHEHRVVAERMLGRPLKPGEVVHPIDEDKRNNNPDNLMVFPSQKEHAAYHAKMNRFFGISEGGDVQ